MDLINYIEKNYSIILFNQHTIVEKAYGKNSSIATYFPELFSENINLQGIRWEKFFRTPPSFGRAKAEIIQTINNKYYLILYENLEKLNLRFMILLDIDELYQANSTSLSERQLPDQDFNYTSKKMEPIINIINQIANVDSTVFLLGESGVGKTRIARMIHQASQRKDQPFITINCGTIPESLIESELFGYVEGAFTGGRSEGKKGLFEEADQGTVFLDEIAELPLTVQVKLLEVIQEYQIRRVGSSRSQHVDIRIIAATNKDIKSLVKDKLFREDLYYRLNVVPLTIPPLRDREEEIPYLADYFVSFYNHKYGLNYVLNNSIKDKLLEYHWPGNIRELENIIERMVVTNSYNWIPGDNSELQQQIKVNSLMPLKEAKIEVEKELISRAYKKYKTTYKAAEVLKVHQSTIAKKILTYNISK